MAWDEICRPPDGSRLGRHRYIRCIETVVARHEWDSSSELIYLGPPARTYEDDTIPEELRVVAQVDEYFIHMLPKDREEKAFLALQEVRNSIKNGFLTYLPAHQIPINEFANWWRDRAAPGAPVPSILTAALAQESTGMSADDFAADAEAWTDAMRLAIAAWREFWSDPNRATVNPKRDSIVRWLMAKGLTKNKADAIQSIIRPDEFAMGGAKK